MRHRTRTWREQCHVGTALLLKLQLPAQDRLTDLVVRHAQRLAERTAHAGKLRLSPGIELRRRRRIVPVDVDDHVRECTFPRSLRDTQKHDSRRTAKWQTKPRGKNS